MRARVELKRIGGVIGLLVVGWLYLWVTGVLAADSTQPQVWSRRDQTGMNSVTVTMTASSATAGYSDVTLSREIKGIVLLAQTNPGAVAPTDNYDIVVNNEDSLDIFGGALANRDSTNTEWTMPLLNGNYTGVPVDGQLTIQTSNNSVNSAVIEFILYWIGM